MVTTELDQYTGLLDVTTGEVLPATVGNAAKVINAARAMKQNVNAIVQEATAYLVRESEHIGTKTLHDDKETVTITGGPFVDYPPTDLIDALRAAGCPENRIDQAVKTVITYKVDRAVLRQLAGANPDYKAAIDSVATEVDRAYSASVALRRQTSDD